MKNLFRLCGLLVVIACLTGSAFAALDNDPVYEKNCAKCHGKTGDGRHFGGPPLQKTTLSLEEIKTMIANGKGRMPKFADKLTNDQIDALSAEIKELSKSQQPH